MIKKLIHRFVSRYYSTEDITSMLYFSIRRNITVRFEEKHKSTISYHFFGMVKELKLLKSKGKLK
jgi:hypothetical protein